MKNIYFINYCLLFIFISFTNSYSMAPNIVKPSRPYCETKYPIILVPGVIGFDKLIGTVDYFYGIERNIEKDGGVVFSAALTGWASTEMRGKQLLNYIEEIKSKNPEFTKFNIVGHSYGATTARYVMRHRPDLFASLTTVAGPHQGTPVADYFNEDIPDSSKTFVFGGIELLAGDFIALISGHSELVGTQDMESCINHFTIDGIEKFNNEYPCAGVPEGASRGTYGDDADFIEGSYFGDGQGNANGDIRFYSWTGNIGSNDITSVDILDSVAVVTNTSMRSYGYKGDADCFIPVSSSHFGEVLNDSYYLNHFDEINQTLGIINPFSANPVSIFRQHANRLQNAGY